MAYLFDVSVIGGKGTLQVGRVRGSSLHDFGQEAELCFDIPTLFGRRETDLGAFREHPTTLGQFALSKRPPI